MNLPIMPKIQIPKHICNDNNNNNAPDMPDFQSGGYKLLALCIFLSAGLWRQHQWGTVGDKQDRPEEEKDILRAVRTVSTRF